MRYAFLLMGDYDTAIDRAAIRQGSTRMIGVANLDEAEQVARELHHDGIDCIELCGAFGEAGARRIIDATGGEVAVGFVVHLPEQDPLFEAVFGA